MENIINPGNLCKRMEHQLLLKANQLNLILAAPMDYMRNFYIFNHICKMSLPELFAFLDILKESDDHKYISDKLTKGTYVTTYKCMCISK